MDGLRLQNRLYSGYAKTATRIGLVYDQYRSSTHLLPLDSSNKIDSFPVAFSADLKFDVSNKYAKPVWYCWADGRKLKQFDFLVGPMGTFFVGDKQTNLPIQAVQTNHVVSLGRVNYTIIPATVVNYATSIPVFVQFKREEIKASPLANVIGEAVTRWLTFIPLPEGTIKQDDVVVDEEGISYVMDAPDFTNIGYVASMRKSSL
jgi:hypothetical protein